MKSTGYAAPFISRRAAVIGAFLSSIALMRRKGKERGFGTTRKNSIGTRNQRYLVVPVCITLKFLINSFFIIFQPKVLDLLPI